MTFEMAAARYTPKKAQSRSTSLLPVNAKRLLPVKWQPARHSRRKYSPIFFVAMAVSIVCSISFFYVLSLAI